MTRRISSWDVAYFVLIAPAILIAGYHLSHGLYAQELFTQGAAGDGQVLTRPTPPARLNTP